MMDTLQTIKHALEHCSGIKVLGKQQATQVYGPNTLTIPIQLDGALIVSSEQDVSECLKVANQVKIQLNPISTNNNWGYGSLEQGDERPIFVLDLKSLNKIEPTSKEMGLITLGPGVTQQQLYDYLSDNEWPYMVPVTGAGPHCSILSNAVERGYGITPHNDHFYACTAIKGYLPHPELCDTLYESAVSAIDKSNQDFVDKSYKWGLGPYLDGLFTQSNLGVVTEMTIRLAPKPQHFTSFYLRVEEEAHFNQAVTFVQSVLKDYAGIVASVNLMDIRRLISITCDNPNMNSANKVLTDQQVSHLAKKNKLPQWMIVGSIYSEAELVKPIKKALVKRSKGLGKIIFSDSNLLKMAKTILSKLPINIESANNALSQLNSLAESTDVMLGKPNQVALPLPYWRNPRIKADKNQTLSPSKDKCGLLWYAPLIPMTPSALHGFTQFVRQVTPKYNIDPLITFTNLKHDCVDSTIPLVFDLENSEEVKNAHTCLNELINEGAKYGYVPYRLDTKQQQKLDKNHIFWKTTAKIKQTLDPHNILCPWRYNP